MRLKMTPCVAALVTAAILSPQIAAAHVGQTAPAKWVLRLEVKAKSGKANSKQVYAWKVPLATFNKQYDDRVDSPLAQVITQNAPEPGGFEPLWLEIPGKNNALCMQGATLEFASETGGRLCDGGAALRDSEGVPQTMSNNSYRNWMFGEGYWWNENPKCVNVSISKGAGCTQPASYQYNWETGTYSYSSEEGGAASTATDQPCTVTVSGQGIGAQAVQVSGSWPGSTVSLGDLWWYGKTLNNAGATICQAGLESSSCGSAGSPSQCGYFGMTDTISKGLNIPLDRAAIMAASRRGAGLLLSQANGWMNAGFKREQLMSGYFTHILSDVKLIVSTNSSTDVSKWTSENADVQWTVFMDNTAGSRVGRNSAGTYGDVQIRRTAATLEKPGTEGVLVCSYASRPAVYLPDLWQFKFTGYLSCALMGPATAAEPRGAILKDNIFLDPANPDSKHGLNLHNAYDDRSNDDPDACALNPDICVDPFIEGSGAGDKLIKEIIQPLISEHGAEAAVLGYQGAASFTNLNRMYYDINGSSKYVMTATVRSTGGTHLSQSIEDATPPELGQAMAGQSFQIDGRSVDFPSCGSGPITMTQNWTWDAENALPELHWRAWQVYVPPQATYQILKQSSTTDTETNPNGNGLDNNPSFNTSSTRTAVPVPFSVAMFIPQAWKPTVDALWNSRSYSAGSLGNGLPSAGGNWSDIFYPPILYPSRPGAGLHQGPYFVLDPQAYQRQHQGYWRAVDAHLWDGRGPLNASSLPTSLNHTFRHAPENGTVSGNLLQLRQTLKCDTKVMSKCCTKYKPDGACEAWGAEYEACASYHCETSYCEWGMNRSQNGLFRTAKDNDSCSWEALDTAVLEYTSKQCLLPATWHNAGSPVTGRNSLSEYIQWRDEGIKTTGVMP